MKCLYRNPKTGLAIHSPPTSDEITFPENSATEIPQTCTARSDNQAKEMNNTTNLIRLVAKLYHRTNQNWWVDWVIVYRPVKGAPTTYSDFMNPKCTHSYAEEVQSKWLEELYGPFSDWDIKGVRRTLLIEDPDRALNGKDIIVFCEEPK